MEFRFFTDKNYNFSNLKIHQKNVKLTFFYKIIFKSGLMIITQKYLNAKKNILKNQIEKLGGLKKVLK